MCVELTMADRIRRMADDVATAGEHALVGTPGASVTHYLGIPDRYVSDEDLNQLATWGWVKVGANTWAHPTANVTILLM